MALIVTDEGKVDNRFKRGTDKQPYSVEEAAQVVEHKNKAAEELGIKTRYRVEEDDNYGL